MHIKGIILAAGNSERMGKPKALLPYYDTTFLGRGLVVLRYAGIEDVVVVAGTHASEIKLSGDLGASPLLVNPDPSRGQLSSLQIAIDSFNNDSYEAALVWLVDHPGVSAETAKKLIDALDDSSDFVRPRFGQRHGHPLLISHRMFSIILEMPLDQGLKPLFSSGEYSIVNVPVADRNVLQDIDTPEDYRKSVENEDKK